MAETTHRHTWEEITDRASPYTVQRCNGLGGCGTIRRIDKRLYRGWQTGVEAPPDAAWEVMFQGVEGPCLTRRSL